MSFLALHGLERMLLKQLDAGRVFKIFPDLVVNLTKEEIARSIYPYWRPAHIPYLAEAHLIRERSDAFDGICIPHHSRIQHFLIVIVHVYSVRRSLTIEFLFFRNLLIVTISEPNSLVPVTFTFHSLLYLLSQLARFLSNVFMIIN